MTEVKESVENPTPEEQKQTGGFLNSKPLKVGILLKKPRPKREWLVKGLIPLGGITTIFGDTGVYKTRVTNSMVLAAAQGKPWITEFETTQVGTLEIDQENGEDLMWEMFAQLGAEGDLPIYIISLENFTVNEENINKVLEHCLEYGLKVVVIDPLSYSHDADENKAKEMSQVMIGTQPLLKAGIGVILLHHAKKPSADGWGGRYSYRGSSVIAAASSSVLSLTLNDERLTIAQYKSRYTRPVPAFCVDVLGDDDHMEFVYAGLAKGEARKAEENEAARFALTEILGKQSPLLQYELIDRLKEAGHNMDDKKLNNKILPPLLRDGVVVCERGKKGNTKMYSLYEQPANKIPSEPRYEETVDVSFTQEDFDEVMSGSMF